MVRWMERGRDGLSKGQEKDARKGGRKVRGGLITLLFTGL